MWDIVACLNMYCPSSPPIGGVSDELLLKEFCHSAIPVTLIPHLCMPSFVCIANTIARYDGSKASLTVIFIQPLVVEPMMIVLSTWL